MEKPNYKKIYLDLISLKFPERKKELNTLLSDIKTSLEIININNVIFNEEHETTFVFNQKLRSYDQESINKILEYQKNNNLNNQQVSNKFKISRNSIAKWKKLDTN